MACVPLCSVCEIDLWWGECCFEEKPGRNPRQSAVQGRYSVQKCFLDDHCKAGYYAWVVAVLSGSNGISRARSLLWYGSLRVFACAMQGTASMAEDLRQPPYLCPVCAKKVARAVEEGSGEEFDEEIRTGDAVEAMMKLCVN